MVDHIVNQAWRQHAACRGMDLSGWFPEDGETPAGLAVCAVCPVQDDCLQAGKGELGVWGGLGESARRRLRRTEPLQVKPGPGNLAAQCGTEAGYYAHLRSRTDTCTACRDAHSLANLVRYHARRGKVCSVRLAADHALTAPLENDPALVLLAGVENGKGGPPDRTEHLEEAG